MSTAASTDHPDVTDRAGAPDPAALWRRSLAALLDAVIGLGTLALSAMWLVLGLWALRGLRRDALEALVLLASVLALAAALHVAYRVAFVGGCGQTPGQIALGIAVMRQDLAPAGHGRAFLRVVGGVLDALLLWLPTALLLFGPDRRGLADRVAGTRVVLLRRGGAGDGRLSLERLQLAEPLVERRVGGQ
jgi:uncharacterized RDD family membrane protein YckC